MLKLNSLSGFGSGGAGAVAATYGYFCAGRDTTDKVLTTDRITFADGTIAAHTDADLSVAGGSIHEGVSDTTTYGYVGGGNSISTPTPSWSKIVERITFSTSTTAVNTDGDLAVPKRESTGISDGTTYGYWHGGEGTSNTNIDTTDRVTFADSTVAANTDSDLVTARSTHFSVSDGATYGYSGGGWISVSPYKSFAVERMTFSTGVFALNTDSDLTTAAAYPAGISDNATYGYVLGGNTGAKVDTAERLTFATGVMALNTDSDLSGANGKPATASDGLTYGYMVGGHDGSSYLDKVDRITFATSVTAVTAVTLSTTRNGSSGLSDGAV